MKALSKDPLLAVTRLVLTALLVLAVVVTAAALVAVPVMIAKRGEIAAGLAGQSVGDNAVWWICALCALIALMGVMAFLFVRELRRIVGSVAQGDPFAPINAERLRRMGWIALGYQFVALPMTNLAVWFDAAPYHPNVHHGTVGIDVGALILALVLFILARVFRKGAEMREELEGTV